MHEATAPPQAEFSLGVMHGLGLGTQQDYVESVRWYRLAAERGHLQAQSNLGFMYGTGRGVPQDFVRALAWYSVSAAAGDDTARHNRDLLNQRMTPAQVERAQELAQDLAARSSVE